MTSNKSLRSYRPEHTFAEFIKGPDGLPPPLFAQPMFHMLANIISSKAYPELSTVEQALTMSPPEKAQFRIIASADAAKPKPVFPQWTSKGQKDKHQSPTAWGSRMNKWGIRTGLAEGVSVHCIRREALIKADGKMQSSNAIESCRR